MATIAGVHGVVAPYGYPQADLTAAFATVVSPDGSHRATIERIHEATGVARRYLSLPIDEYPNLSGFGDANDAFIRVGLDLAADAVRGALNDACLESADVDYIFTTSVTGIAAPSLDSRLQGRLGFREDIKRVPVFGLGCVAGVSGIARLHDYLQGHPDDVAVLVAVELCSLTVQRDDASMPNIVASGLFGDGAAAVVMVGERRAARLGLRGPFVVDSRSRLYPDTERTMGWDVGGSGFRIVLSASVPDIVSRYVGADVAAFLAMHSLTTADIGTWVSHPGGPRVLEALESTLDLHNGELGLAWQSLSEVGNLSSASVLHVLAKTLEAAAESEGAPEPGTPGLLLAMGPGFCAELVLFRW